MALSELSEAKKKALKKRIQTLSMQGKNYRQTYRTILKEFNIKLTLPKKNELL
jgi:hypothetical protein